MSMDDFIKQQVMRELLPTHMELVNDSARHHGHAGDDGSGETHYSLLVVSARFEGLSRVERQRLVHAALKEALERGVHALSLRCHTPGEYGAS